MPVCRGKVSFVPVVMTAIEAGKVYRTQLPGFSLCRNSVLRAFMAPAPVPSAVIDHTLM